MNQTSLYATTVFCPIISTLPLTYKILNILKLFGAQEVFRTNNNVSRVFNDRDQTALINCSGVYRSWCGV